MVALQAGAAGFLDAPVTRGLCAAVASGTVAAWVAEGKDVQVSNVVARELLQQLGLATAWQAIVCLSLLYNFRLLERRIGSGRFGAFVAYGVACSSIARAVSSRVLPDLRWLPGPVSIVVACVPPVLCNVASPAAASMFGLPITDKAYVLMAVTQLAISSGLRSIVPALTGFVTGALYQGNIFGIRRWSLSAVLRRLVRRGPPPSGRAARVRVAGVSAPAHSGLRYTGGDASTADAHRHAPVQVSEAHVQQLVEMGFDEGAARSALQQSGNSVDLALGTLVS